VRDRRERAGTLGSRAGGDRRRRLAARHREGSEKAVERGSSAEFLIADVLDLDTLDRRFRTALDCGVFHVFDDRERPIYVASLASVLEPGGVLHLLCFSDRQPGDTGPRRVTQQELRDAFVDGWEVREIVPTTFVATLPGGGADAWRATIARLG